MTKTMKILLAGFAASAASSIGATASASASATPVTEYTYNWYATGAEDNGSGQFTSQDTIGNLIIDSFSGTFDNQTITQISHYEGADNTYYANSPHLSYDGTSFDTTSDSYNVYYYNGYYKVVDINSDYIDVLYSFSATTALSAVPEPATWAMMLVGMGAIGFAMRRRQNVRVTYA